MAAAPGILGQEFHMPVLPFFPGILGSSQFACPAPGPNSGVMGHETQSVGHRTPRGCLSHSWVWWGGRRGRPCQGRTAELAIASAMLRLSSSAVSSHTGMSGQIHRFPDLSKLVFPPTHLVGKQLQLPSPNHPPFSGPWYWVSIWCSLQLLQYVVKSRMILLRSGARQGCLLPSLLLVTVLEILANVIR